MRQHHADARVELLFQLTLGRVPDSDERQLCRQLVDAPAEPDAAARDPLGPWGQLAQTLLMSNELAFID